MKKGLAILKKIATKRMKIHGSPLKKHNQPLLTQICSEKTDKQENPNASQLHANVKEKRHLGDRFYFFDMAGLFC